MRVFLLSALFIFKSIFGYSQSIKILNEADQTPIPYATLSFIFEHDSSTFIADNKGQIVLSKYDTKEFSMKTLHVSAIGFTMLDTVMKLDKDKNYLLYLKPIEHILETVEVKTKPVYLKPDRTVIKFSKFIRFETEKISETIPRLPGIVEPVKGNFVTAGNKNVVVYLDGRKISNLEQNNLLSVNIAKAELLLFPSADMGDNNSAILFLTSSLNKSTYSFSEITSGYSFGVKGPNLLLSNANKWNRWSSNLMINYYKYFDETSSIIEDNYRKSFLKDTTGTTRNAIIFNYLINYSKSNDNIKTFGVIGNFIYGNNLGNYLQVTPTPQKAEYQYKIKSPSLTFYGAFKNKLPSVGIMNTTMSFSSKSNMSDFFTNNVNNSNSSYYTYDFSLNNRLKFNAIQFRSGEINQNASLGISYLINESKKTFNNIASPIRKFNDNNIYLGYAVSYEKNKWKYDLSSLLNIFTRNGYQEYKNFYFYPKSIFSYLLNEQSSFALSFSVPNYKPSPDYFVQDTFRTKNWYYKLGNKMLINERDLNTEFLYTYNGEKIYLQSIISYLYAKNGIVSTMMRTPDSLIAYSYLNKNYSESKFSNSIEYTPSDKITFSGLLELNRISFGEALPKYFKQRWSIKSTLTATVNFAKGSLSSTFNYEGSTLYYLRIHKTYPDLSFYYMTKLGKNFDLNFEASNIFNNYLRKRDIYNIEVIEISKPKERTFSISLKWRFGKNFPILTGGSPKTIVNDTKKVP